MNTRLHIANILNGGWASQTFKPFRTGIDICIIHDGSINTTLLSPTQEQQQPGNESASSFESGQPTVALLRYAAGATVPRHKHIGIETILVLEGSQSDEQGKYQAGSIVINPVDSIHSVWSEDGCIVLIQWDKPVEFI